MKKAKFLAVMFGVMTVLRAEAETSVASYQVTWVPRSSFNGDTLILPVMKVLDGLPALAVSQGMSPTLPTSREGALTFTPGGDCIFTLSSTEKVVHGLTVFDAEDQNRAAVVRYGVTGEVSCDMPEGFAYLQLTTRIGDNSGEDLDRAAAIEGPRRRMEGSQVWRPFQLSCAAYGKAVPEERLNVTAISLTLQWEGTGTVSLRNVKVVQYRPTIPLTPLEQKQAVKWGWIGGVGGGLLGLLGGVAVVAAVVLRQRRLRREEELRRMASLDARGN